MKVNKELIEKYHLGLCSPEEEQAVENWLLDDQTEEVPLWLTENEKQSHQREMWGVIANVLPSHTEETTVRPLISYFTPLVKKSIAASFVLGLLGTGIIWWLHETVWTHPVAVVNHENTGSGKIQTNGLNIFLGSKSQANINASGYHRRGNIDFCGIILINPKEDIELTLNASCKSQVNTHEKMTFKKGQKYIAVNYHFNTDDELIVVDERNIMNLPPALQKEIIKQFNI